MTDKQINAYHPPVARLELPYQVLERKEPAIRDWLLALRRFALRQAPHE
jgi:hypothetical protein